MKLKKGKIRVKTEACNGLSDFLESNHTVVKNIGKDQIVIDSAPDLILFIYNNVITVLPIENKPDSSDILRALRKHGAFNFTDTLGNRIRVGVVKNVSGNGVPGIRITIDRKNTKCALLTKRIMSLIFSEWGDNVSGDQMVIDMWEEMARHSE